MSDTLLLTQMLYAGGLFAILTMAVLLLALGAGLGGPKSPRTTVQSPDSMSSFDSTSLIEAYSTPSSCTPSTKGYTSPLEEAEYQPQSTLDSTKFQLSSMTIADDTGVAPELLLMMWDNTSPILRETSNGEKGASITTITLKGREGTTTTVLDLIG